MAKNAKLETLVAESGIEILSLHDQVHALQDWAVMIDRAFQNLMFVTTKVCNAIEYDPRPDLAARNSDSPPPASYGPVLVPFHRPPVLDPPPPETA